ncbi:MAG: carboxypeptidase regulatory-like domain-containing protein [Vulcanimicrobiaceae bacterium]
MGVRSVFGLFLALMFANSASRIPVADAQQLGPGEVVVVVTDAQTHLPLANADVFLLGGEEPESSLTDAHGRLTFPAVAPGTYSVGVLHDGYRRYDVPAFDLGPHSRVTLSVAMMPVLKTIASVTAHASSAVSSEDINADSAQRKISETLGDALGKLAGVNVYDDPSGADSAFNVSLHNHDESQTAYSIDGIRIVGPASGLLGAGQNLFTGASVSFAPTAGYIGGSLNFQTLRPTKLWTYDFKSSIGNYGTQTVSLSATGTKGRLAMAAQHVSTRKDAFLSGLTYEDQSGQRYLHQGGNTATGDLVKLDYTLNKRTSALFSGMFTRSTYDTICSDFTTVLPCGNGPVSRNSSHNNYTMLAIDSLVGNVSANLTTFVPFGSNAYDYPQRTLNGVLSPYFSRGSYNGSGVSLNGSVTARRHTDTAGIFFSQFGGTVNRAYNGATLTVVQPVEQFRNAVFSDRIKANEKLAITHGLSVESGTNAGSSLGVSETADWTPEKHDSFEGSVSVGSARPVYGVQFPVTDALSSDIDCHNGSVYVDGPADKAMQQSSVSYDLTWRHTYKTGNLNVDIYRQNAYGQELRLSVPILAEPNDIFGAGLPAFLQQLESVWSSPTVCGSIPFDPRHVYISQMVTGLGQVNQGFTISGRVGLGRDVAAFPTYALGSTYLSSLDPRVELPGAYYGVGNQLPHRPLRTAGLTIDGVMPKSKLEWLANAEFTGINNGHDLPAYTTFSAGLVFQTNIGSLTLLESNVFGTRSGLFSTYQGVNPIPVIGGGTFAFASDPLPPRQWLLTWDIPWHQRTSAPTRTHSP